MGMPKFESQFFQGKGVFCPPARPLTDNPVQSFIVAAELLKLSVKDIFQHAGYSIRYDPRTPYGI
jgi:hypothetical protein